MRILILVHSLTGGGAERVASLWVNGFVERGNEVGVVLNCPKYTPQTYSISNYVIQYNIYNRLANRISRRSGWGRYQIFRLRRIIKDFNPDFIIGIIQPWAEWARKACKGMRIPIINTEHNSFERPQDALYNPMTSRLYKEKYEWNKRYAHVTVLTEADKKCIGNLFNATVLPNPLYLEPAHELPYKQNIILAVGRLNAWHVKGFDVLIKAWGLIAKDYPDWILQIAGDGNEQSKLFLKNIIKEVGVESQIEFLGFQDNLLPIYQRSSIFVLSSRYEGLGMVLIEAMSQGCAPIACDYKGRQKEIITTEEDGLICSPDNVDELAAAISKLIQNNKLRGTIQNNAIEKSKFYNLNRIMDKWEGLLSDLKTQRS